MDNQYPIGKYKPVPYSDAERDERIAHLQAFPRLMEAAVEGLSEQDLQQPYREGGWMIHQLVHHVADSHMNAFIRIKLALTEDTPTIAPYEEKLWATTPDVMLVPINHSVTLLHALHARWTELMRSVDGDDWEKSVFHPGSQRNMSVWFMLGTYAWHGRHHATQIIRWRESK